MRRRFLNNTYVIMIISKEYFTIESLEDGLQAKLSVNACEYSLDGNTWNSLSAATNTPAVNTGEKIYFKGNLIPASGEGIGTFTISKKCNLKGNIMSLLYGDDFEGQTDLTGKKYVFNRLFDNCTTIIDASKLILPAETLEGTCYQSMFQGCTSLTSAPSLPATTLASSCYQSMFYNCTSLTAIPALPARTLATQCYYNMFGNCTGLTASPELPATTLAEFCYASMFSGCTGLTTAPELPATTLATWCYRNMFSGCTGLTSAPSLPATTLASNCYYSMFYGCSKLNYIKMLATDIGASSCLNNWVYGVASSGRFVKHTDMTTLPSGSSGIPSGWTVNDNITLLDCISLEIIADDVNGKKTNTTIYYTAQVNALDEDGNQLVVTKTGTAISEEFPQNTSETESIDRTITFTYMGVTATTIITQGVWVVSYTSYTIMLNDQWQLSDKPNPDTSLYDGVYESFSNKGVNGKAAIMYIDIDGYTDFNLYIRSYAESNFDYVMVSQLDQSINNDTSYSNTTLVKSHTRGKQTSGTDISNYTHVQFTNIDGGEHRITIVYRKDVSSESGDDKGYILIEKLSYVETNLITFTIDGIEYQAEEGMTWEQWVNSEYNTDGYYIIIWDDGVYKSIHKDDLFRVGYSEPTDIILKDNKYVLQPSPY